LASGTPEPSSTDSVELVRAAQRGEKDALGRLMERYYPRVLGIVRARLGDELRRNTESIDVAQEAFGQAVRAFEHFELRDDDAFVRWMAQLVENRLRDLAKYQGRAKRGAGREVHLESLLAAGGSLSHAFDPADSAVTPASEVAKNEEQQRALAALAKLPAEQREVLRLRAAGVEWNHVAERLGLASVGAARGLHARAALALMRACEGPGGTSEA
jgi:RNA polymerase sigma-70 factor (ECF subfamily)